MEEKRFHYGWIIIILGFLIIGGALGIGRFSYGILLPSLQEGIELSHQEAGFIASANMLGYCLASLIVGSIVFRLGARKVIFLSMLVVGLTMMAVGISGGVIVVVLLRFITGLGSAGANLTLMGLSSAWFAKNCRGTVNGFLVGGSGFAMLFTGRLVPMINELYPERGWQYNWYILGAIALVIAMLVGAFIRNHPQEIGLLPMSRKGATSKEAETNERILGLKEIISSKGIKTLAFIYFCYGISYVIYTTFFVNYLVLEKGVTQMMAGGIWSIVGLLSIGSAIIWGGLSDVTGRPTALTIVLFVQSLCYILLAIAAGEWLMWVSAVLFGLTAWGVPGIMASYCGDLFGSKNATTSLGFITLLFSIGSILGPIAAGYIKEISSSYANAFFFATALALLGCVFAFTQIKVTAVKPAARRHI